MIYRCENCKNRNGCHENKEQYITTCNILSAVASGLDELPESHCYYSLTVRCDYWCEDKETYISTMESEEDSENDSAKHKALLAIPHTDWQKGD